MKALCGGVHRWLILLFALASLGAAAQGDIIHYDSGYTWRAYTGTTAPTCSSKLCRHYPVYSFDSYYREFTAWKSLSGDPNAANAFMNFRVLFPPGYSVSNQSKTYPLVIMMHGAGESGRVWTDHYNYEQTNPMYDNNGHQLRYGGNEHRIAAAKTVSDPTSCQAIVVFPQSSYSATWSDLSKTDISESEQILLGFIENQMIAKYHADPNKVIMHGLSNGARELWALATKRPDLFAAILPMSGAPEKVDLTADMLVTTPVWIFQGGLDINPTPAATQQVVAAFEARGGSPRVTVYSDVDHETWFRAYKEPDFFSWIMSRDKRNVHVSGGSTEICSYPVRLGASAGMMKYQWMRNGVEFAGATGRYLTVSAAGTYSVKFQRRNGQWVQSFPVQMTAKAGCVITSADPLEVLNESKVYPNPTGDIVTVIAGREVDVSGIAIISMTGQRVEVPIELVEPTTFTADLTSVAKGVYVIKLTDSGQSFVVIKR